VFQILSLNNKRIVPIAAKLTTDLDGIKDKEKD